MVFNTDYAVEDYALNTRWEDFPDDVRERAIRCSIDLFGALILGSRGKQFEAGLRLAKMQGLVGDIPVVGCDARLNVLGATIAMSHASNSFDIDDGYNMIKGHPGTSFIAGLLSAALQENCSYREFLTALVVCYELTIRWGLAMQDHYHFLHSTGSYGAFGTALGVGRMLRLSREQLNNALSVADYHAPMTPVMRAVEYPSMNKDGVPFGALVGVMAVLETLCGETGKTHLLELPEYRHYIDSLAERYYIRELYFKPFTCCRWAHQPILACQTLIRENGIQWEQIESATVHTFKSAALLSKAIPTNTDEAQYNIAFPVASAIVNGDVGFVQIRDEALNDARVLSVMSRLRFVVDPDMEREFPQKRLAWVDIRMKTGEAYRSRVYEAPGEHSDPELSYAWIVDKFRRVTAPIIGAEGQNRIIEALSDHLDTPMLEIVTTLNHCIDDGMTH